MAETLSRKLSAEMIVGTIPRIMDARGVKPINHALFADDSLLLRGALLNIARAFNGILHQFCSISGGLINREKSGVFGWNVDPMKMHQISNILGFPGFVQWVKIKYLGLPLTLGTSPPSLWLDVLSKLKAKIVSLGGHWLTKAGKLILIKSVLSSLPIFQSSLLLAPKSISTQIANILRDFLWSGGKGNKKNPLG